jgi:hypothetical protein
MTEKPAVRDEMVAAPPIARICGRVIEASPRTHRQEAPMRKHRDVDDLPGFHRHT